MDRALVAAFYRAKGYTVREAMVAVGHSGNSHRVPLLCEGPLGNLAVFFGDHDGIDGPEMGGARRVAKDLGATPVLAAPSFTNAQRGTAADLGVVLLDRDALTPEVPPASTPARPWPEPAPSPRMASDEFAAHPWPESGRPGGRDGVHARTFEVDDLLRELDRPRPAVPATKAAAAGPAPATVALSARVEPPLAPPAAPGSAPAPAPFPGASPGDAALWKRPRDPTPRVPAAGAAGTLASSRRDGAASAKFAWLGLPPVHATKSSPGAGLEHSDVVHARAPVGDAGAVAVTVEDSPALAHATAEEMWQRRSMRRKWARRAAWTVVLGTLAYAVSQWYGQ